MSLHLPDRIGFFAIAMACGVVGCTDALQACGPFFPNQVLLSGDAGILQMPVGTFVTELSGLSPPEPAPFKAFVQPPSDWDTVFVESAKVDEAELSQAANPIDPQTLEQYKYVRAAIATHAAAINQTDKSKIPKLPDLTVPKGLPAEFDLYLSGLIAFHQDNIADAQKAWTDLLALPVDQRKHRSTWAAFMLGKSQLDRNPAKAIEYFTLTRELATNGFSDSLGLASSSIGWQAKVELNAGHLHKAVELYIQQNWTGDLTAAYSLRECAQRILSQGQPALADAAADPNTCRVIAAYILCNGGRFGMVTPPEKKLIPAWLAAVESTAVKDMPGADRLAWMAYNSGDFTAASGWVQRAPAESPVAQWVQAKLLLRDGKIDSAAGLLAKTVHAFPKIDLAEESPDDPGVDSQTIPQAITSDLAVLQLARGQYSDSMQLLLRADHWMDAAYIAERVLTLDELKQSVDRHNPEVSAAKLTADMPVWHASSTNLRALLARRLTRAGRWAEARPYYTPELRPKLDDYIAGIRDGHDRTRSPADRAASFLSAAQIAETSGMELLGTELDPDYACFDGQFQGDPKAREKMTGAQLTAPSADELARYKSTAAADPRRFHYRYIAAAHAWSAAELMPDNTDQTAKVLYDAGCWLKDRDPAAADKFYKALVHRCPDTQLGKSAAAAHWFPKTK